MRSSGSPVSRPVGWGIVGYGWVAHDFVAPAIASAGHRLVAIADPDPSARGAAGTRSIAAYDTAEALAADPDVDAVYVATPNHRHREGVAAAARAGKPILCEKPMAATVDDAAAIAAIVRERGVFYRTAFDQRHHPAHRAIRDVVTAGRLGVVTAIRIVYACWLGPDWQADNWRIDPTRAGGGALIDLAPHGLDLAAFLVDDEIVDVHATVQRRVHDYPVDDGAIVSAATRSGVLVALHVAYNHPETLPRRRLEIVGTRGTVVATDTMGQEPGGSVAFTPADGDASPITLRFDRDASPFREQIVAFVDAWRRAEACGPALDRDLALFRLLMHASARASGRLAERAPCP